VFDSASCARKGVSHLKGRPVGSPARPCKLKLSAGGCTCARKVAAHRIRDRHIFAHPPPSRKAVSSARAVVAASSWKCLFVSKWRSMEMDLTQKDNGQRPTPPTTEDTQEITQPRKNQEEKDKTKANQITSYCLLLLTPCIQLPWMSYTRSAKRAVRFYGSSYLRKMVCRLWSNILEYLLVWL
jgi:hypothetical protein